MPRHVFAILLSLAAGPLSGQTTETMVVIATRVDTPVTQAPVAVTVIGAPQIETSPATNAADLLRGSPGVNIVHTSARDIGIRTRGASGVAEHRQLVLIDGRTNYLDFYGIVLWDALPVDFDAIRQIEVQRGPGSAMWGPNAFSGVINVRTKSPREMKGGLATITLGERNTRGASIRWAAATDQYAYKITASGYREDAWPRDNVLPNGAPVPDAYRFANRGTNQSKADLRFDWGKEDAPLWSARAGYGGTTGIFHSRLGPFLVQPGTYVGYAEVDRISNSFDSKVYWNRLHGTAPNLINFLDFNFQTDTFAAETTAHRGVGSNQALVYGASLRDSHFDLSIAPGARSRHEVGIFAEDTILLPRNVTVNAGARADHFNAIGTEFSPRLSVILQPRPHHFFRVAYNRAYRPPSVADIFLETSVPNPIVLGGRTFVFRTGALGNEDLKVESIDAFEVGYTFERGSRSSFTASAYRNRVKNNIVFVPTAFYSPSDPPAGWPGAAASVPPSLLPKTLSFVNVGQVIEQGIELSWDANWRNPLSTRLAYTLQREPRVSSNSSVPLQINRPPQHQASALAIMRNARWFASAAGTYAGRAFWADVLDSRFWGFTPSYFMLDAAVGAPLNERMQVALTATDLLDRRIKEHAFGDVIRRRVLLNLKYRF